jgi:hypothetical protein
MRHLVRAYKLATTYKMTLRYFLVNIHINNQPTLYKMNGVVDLGKGRFSSFHGTSQCWSKGGREHCIL